MSMSTPPPDPLLQWRRQRWRGRLVRVGVFSVAVASAGAGWWWWPTPQPTRELVYPSPEPRPTRAPPLSSAADGPAPRPDTDVDLTFSLDDLIDEINARRDAGARCGGRDLRAPPLTEDLRLTDASTSHALWMIDRDDYTHVTRGNPDGDHPQDRASTMGFAGPVSENIAWGQRTPRQVVRWWVRSPTHCPVLMDPDARWVGVAAEPDPETSGWVWVMMTGR